MERVVPMLIERGAQQLGPEVAARTLSVFGFSKGFGLAGLRLGYLVTPSPAVHADLLGLTHATETAYGASTLSQVAGLAAYEHAEPWLERFVAHLHRERDYAVDRLNAIEGVSCHTPEGTFVLFPNVGSFGVDVEELARDLLHNDRVAVVPGSPRFFGPTAAGHLRLSFATSHEILAEGLDRLGAGLDRVRRQAPSARP